MASSPKDGEKLKGMTGGSDKSSSPKGPLERQQSALGAMAQGLAGMALVGAKTASTKLLLALDDVVNDR